MRMWFEIDVERAPASLCAGGLEGVNFSVLDPGVGISSGANDVAARVRDDGANIEVRRRQAEAFAGQFQRAVEMLFVVVVRWHSGRNLSRKISPHL